MDSPISLGDAAVGKYVEIEIDHGVRIRGHIAQIQSKSDNFLGIKVKLSDGSVGRIKKYAEPTPVDDPDPLQTEFRKNLELQESQNLEFKASFLLNLDRYERSQEVGLFAKGPHSIAKTIAAFANSQGGTLYVGIRDDRQILGLKKDCEILEDYKDRDEKISISSITINSNGEFIFALKCAMEQLLGRYDYLHHVKPHIIKLPEGKDICVIKVKKSKTPIILTQGEKPEFYVRNSDQSELYDSIPRFCDYWCDHLCESS